MVKVEFLGPINKEPIELEISNLSQLREILQKDENVKPWLETSAIAVNDKIVFSKNFKLENGDKIAILPPVCGG
ncbi:MoaD/ThiS family protein [Campylobacter hominis]|uniref:Conserved domain protein n=1 Tax=Campylobacter hominis (strain ATCC BAA-381 / DSM 21671 / CCUG 45161 / LMG 19568 / NCTC 13146 / CH001A) TaxID=360107 RepID=A7HZN9_CAMHC|nr:MoaD/ThiS family protein [Campylobacter hominis]ABS51767.1 conserved domain protein [Campylobacter hominis ATCC BAA-381]UAK85412.1 MoaD/ThiS family protein [Campylobacter hominis]SUW84279.1 molybdopterin synthase sulfur carrier subunit [Campylobacter hominis]